MPDSIVLYAKTHPVRESVAELTRMSPVPTVGQLSPAMSQPSAILIAHVVKLETAQHGQGKPTASQLFTLSRARPLPVTSSCCPRARRRRARGPHLRTASTQPGFIRDGTWGAACAGSKAKSPPPGGNRGTSRPHLALRGTTWHYVAQDRPLHVVVGGCALSFEGVCILGFRPDLHRVQPWRPGSKRGKPGGREGGPRDPNPPGRSPSGAARGESREPRPEVPYHGRTFLVINTSTGGAARIAGVHH